MRKITDKDKKIWNFYTSNLNSIRRSDKNNTSIPKTFDKFPKTLKPNFSFILDQRTKKQLYSKKFEFDASIDLHGKTEFQAFEITKNFIKNSFLNEFKSIIIITGKGINNQGKLKLKVPMWLKSKELSKYIVGFETMPYNKGGEGALFIKIKNKNKYRL